ncbi:MAG: LPXTG cell wall anchor domain-containing protein [Erysipelotrichaceae bacterium]|nr:LPXTG cell wall anchor domain-containing protein [Erysipelotrichaceae bacterium]
MFENYLPVLADIAVDPIGKVAESDGILPIVGAVAAVVIGAVLFLLKKKK